MFNVHVLFNQQNNMIMLLLRIEVVITEGFIQFASSGRGEGHPSPYSSLDKYLKLEIQLVGLAVSPKYIV